MQRLLALIYRLPPGILNRLRGLNRLRWRRKLRIARSYKVFYEKVADGKGGYSVDHAAFTFLLDRSGKYVAFLPPGTKPDRIATLLRESL